jgi:hypothetical protein
LTKIKWDQANNPSFLQLKIIQPKLILFNSYQFHTKSILPKFPT